MHWVEVDGVRVPIRIGGHPALDFCNTWAGWDEPPDPRAEWLRDYATFTVWARHAELVDQATARRLRTTSLRHTRAAARVLTDARRLRTLLHTAVLDPADASALRGVTGYLRRASALAQLVPGPIAAWRVPGSAGLELPLLATALAAGELLTSADLPAVRACPGRECGWLFIDRSGRRRWCSMSSCGNRAKVRAHAERRRAQAREQGY